MNLVIIGFLFHAPGLKLFAKAQLSPLVVKLNIIAAALTVLAMGFAAATGRSVVLAWLVGHLAWSCTLVALTLRGQVTRAASSG